MRPSPSISASRIISSTSASDIFSPMLVTMNLSSSASMYPLPSRSNTRNTFLISSSVSSVRILHSIIRTNSGRSIVPEPAWRRNDKRWVNVWECYALSFMRNNCGTYKLPCQNYRVFQTLGCLDVSVFHHLFCDLSLKITKHYSFYFRKVQIFLETFRYMILL